MDLTIKFIPPDDLVAALRAVADKFGDCSEPLETIADAFEATVLERFSTTPGWAPLSPATIARYGNHPLLRHENDMYNSISPRVYPFSGWIISNATAILHEHGRKPGVGAVSARARSASPRARRTTAAKAAEAAAAGRRTSRWGEMPKRPFMFLDDAMIDQAVETLLDYSVKGFSE